MKSNCILKEDKNRTHFFSVLHFDKGVEKLILKIEILFDDEKEIRESFTVRLEPDQNMVSELGVSRSGSD